MRRDLVDAHHVGFQAWPRIDVDQGVLRLSVLHLADGRSRSMMTNVLKSVLNFVLPEPEAVKCEDCWALEKCGPYLETRRPEYLPKECPNRQPRALARFSATRL